MGCGRFCRLYAAHVPELGVTGGVGHKAGRAIEVGWAGRTMRIVDPVTGDSSTVCLFVGVLPSGRYAFAGPALGMTRNTWLRARVAMCGWFGGSTPRLVCDNLKTGVVRHPREGEVVLNDRYRRWLSITRRLCCRAGSGIRRTSRTRRTRYGTRPWAWSA